MCTQMGTKTISIMDDVYKLLLRNKMRSESFSDVIRRNLKKKRDIMEFAGALMGNANEWGDIKKKIYDDRKKFKLRSYKI